MYGRPKLVLCIHREEKTNVNVIFLNVWDMASELLVCLMLPRAQKKKK